MDPNDPIVKLCVEGMRAEIEGRMNEARTLFMRAWDESRSDYDACVAAHYVARHQKSPEDALRWNQESLKRADAVGGESVREFYPSLYLNLGKAHEDMGNHQEAGKYYDLAAAAVGHLPDGRYGDTVRGAIHQALQRVS